MAKYSEESRKRRAERWDREFIPCKNHPDRRCQRSVYITKRESKCSSCSQKRTNGNWKPMKSTRSISEQRRWRDRSSRTLKKIKENRL